MTTFTPNLSLPLPGDFSSVTTAGGGTIDTVGNRLHAVTQSKDPGSAAYVTADVFGAAGADQISVRFTLQEVLGEDMPSNLYVFLRVETVAVSISVDFDFQIHREPFLIQNFLWSSALLPAIDTSLHRFLLCMDTVTGDYSAQMDAAVISGNIITEGSSFPGPIRYVRFGAVSDHAAFPESFHHELYIGAITVMDGACPPFNQGRCAGASRGSCSRGGGSHCP